MSYNKLGNIPKRVTYFSRPSITSSFRWDDIDDVDDEGCEVSVVPTFVSDSANKTTLKSGKEWAEQLHYDGGKSVRPTAVVFERANDPIEQVRVITLELRSKGGRAYKVLIDDTYYVDLREDVMLDLILTNGVEPGGLIKGPFVWARVGSEMKLIRVGSKLHDKMVEATKFDSQEALVPEIGGVYTNKKGEPFVYLGQMWTHGYDVTENRISWNRQTYTVNGIKPRELVHVYHSAFQLRYPEMDPWFATKSDDYCKKGDPIAWRFHVVKSPSFKIKTGNISVPPNYVSDAINCALDRNKRSDVRYGSAMYKVKLINNARELFNLSPDKEWVHPELADITVGTVIEHNR